MGKRRDDALVTEQSAAGLAVTRAAYPALAAMLGEATPARAQDCAAAESALAEALYKRIDRLNKELGGYGQTLVQHMSVVLNRWPELRADLDAAVESRAEFVALRDRVAGDDLPRFEREFKEQLNKNAIQELAGFNNWLNRQASSIDERVERINEALGAVPYNPGRYIRLEKEPTTNAEWEHYSDSDGKSGGQKEKLAYTILAASLAYQFGLEWGVAKSRDFRFAVIDEAFGRGSDASTRYALELFAKLGLPLLIVTPLQKVHVIEPYVRAIGFVDNPNGTCSRLQTMTIEKYRTKRDHPTP